MDHVPLQRPLYKKTIDLAKEPWTGAPCTRTPSSSTKTSLKQRGRQSFSHEVYLAQKRIKEDLGSPLEQKDIPQESFGSPLP